MNKPCLIFAVICCLSFLESPCVGDDPADSLRITVYEQPNFQSPLWTSPPFPEALYEERYGGGAAFRSMRVGSDLGVMLRYGRDAGGFGSVEPLGANHVVFLESAPNIGDPWLDARPIGILMFRKSVRDQNGKAVELKYPQGVAFRNRVPGLSGPLASEFQSVFVLANSGEEHDTFRFRIWNTKERKNAWNFQIATLYGKGTTLSMWINGQHRTLSAKSDDPRENTFHLPGEGMSLDKLDWFTTTSGTHPGLRITAPKLTWSEPTLKSPPDPAAINPTERNPIPPSANLSRSLNGKWQSDLGPTELVQTGNKVAGTISFTTTGTVGVINGILKGRRLDVDVYVPVGFFASGYIVFAPDGNSGKGKYISSNGTEYDWNPKRQ